MSSTLLNGSNFPEAFTILSLNVFSDRIISGSDQINCSASGTGGRITALTASSTRAEEVMNLVCPRDLRVDTTYSGTHTFYYNVTYVPYDISLVEREVFYGDWVLFGSVLLFLIGFVSWGYFWSVLKPKKHHDTY